MAWMSCHNCGGYVNENGMPNGVLHYLLPFSTWDLYSKTTKPIILYITEGPKNFFTVWKCPDCGCFHLSKVWGPTVLRDYLPVALPSPPRISDESSTTTTSKLFQTPNSTPKVWNAPNTITNSRR